VTKLLIFVGSTAGGYIGWWIGEEVGIMTAFIVSSIGTIAGIYAGYKIAKRIEDG
jgi:uncharacterized membrane protein YfcA